MASKNAVDAAVCGAEPFRLTDLAASRPATLCAPERAAYRAVVVRAEKPFDARGDARRRPVCFQKDAMSAKTGWQGV